MKASVNRVSLSRIAVPPRDHGASRAHSVQLNPEATRPGTIPHLPFTIAMAPMAHLPFAMPMAPCPSSAPPVLERHPPPLFGTFELQGSERDGRLFLPGDNDGTWNPRGRQRFTQPGTERL
jgi:hypothetical protein